MSSLLSPKWKDFCGPGFSSSGLAQHSWTTYTKNHCPSMAGNRHNLVPTWRVHIVRKGFGLWTGRFLVCLFFSSFKAGCYRPLDRGVVTAPSAQLPQWWQTWVWRMVFQGRKLGKGQNGRGNCPIGTAWERRIGERYNKRERPRKLNETKQTRTPLSPHFYSLSNK